MSTLPEMAYQTAVLTVILSALSAVLTPISSAAGATTLIPPSNEPQLLGLWPAVAWILVGFMTGFITNKARESVVPPLLISTVSYLMVVGLSVFVLPKVPGALNWETYLSKLSQQIILEGPLDFLFLFTLPLVTSLLTASIIEALTSKPPPRPTVHRRWYWEMFEED